VEVAGIRDGTDFTRAMGYLQTLAVVQDLTVVSATPEALVLDLKLAVGREGFERFLLAGNQLQADPLSSADRPRYVLQP
jgi:hypothetical protein